MDFFIFISDQWLLVSLGLIMLYLLVWRESSKGGPSISYHELTRLVNADEAVVIDLRDDKEYAAGHITGAVHVPGSKLEARLKELETYRERQLILVDKFGQQTSVAGKQLMDAGFRTAKLKGGMADWQANNLPLIKSK